MSEIIASELQDDISKLSPDEPPSFYGILKKLEKYEQAVVKAERFLQKQISGANLDSNANALADLLDDLQAAVAQCRRWAGTEIQQLPVGLTVLEKPMAIDFISKTKKSIDEHDPQIKKKREMFTEILKGLEGEKTVLESMQVRKLAKQLENDKKRYDKVKVDYEKWQAGKHKFANLTEMQKAKTDYEQGAKQLTKLETKIDAARYVRREEGVEEEEEVEESDSDEGFWATSAKPNKPAVTRKVVRKPVVRRNNFGNNWGGGMTLAQRLMANVVADINGEVNEKMAAEQNNSSSNGG